MISVDHLIFDYPRLRALDDISLRIGAGGVTALVGPNGAGKTTLLRCLAALEQPVAGAISIFGINVLKEPRACHRVIGYLSDFFGLYQRLTVRQALHYVARAQGMPEADCPAAIAAISRRLRIEDRLEMKPGELSRGLRQRVAIAQAAIHAPRVLLLDEPASGLDPEARHELAELFIDLQKQGITILVSSHILAELEAYCTDMLVLRSGRVVEHTALRNPDQPKIFKLMLAWPIDNLADILATLSDVAAIKIEDNRLAVLQITGQQPGQHAVLKAMLALNLPVCEFAPSAGGLQDAYLQTVGRQP